MLLRRLELELSPSIHFIQLPEMQLGSSVLRIARQRVQVAGPVVIRLIV